MEEEDGLGSRVMGGWTSMSEAAYASRERKASLGDCGGSSEGEEEEEEGEGREEEGSERSRLWVNCLITSN